MIACSASYSVDSYITSNSFLLAQYCSTLMIPRNSDGCRQCMARMIASKPTTGIIGMWNSTASVILLCYKNLLTRIKLPCRNIVPTLAMATMASTCTRFERFLRFV